MVNTDEGKERAGVVTLDDDGHITAQATPKYEILMRDLLRDYHIIDGKRRVTKAQDPEAWFNALPSEYSGIRVWAKML